MSFAIRFFALLLMTSQTLFALNPADYRFRLDGTFIKDASPITYTIYWNETGTDIAGVYDDNKLAYSAPLTGKINERQRNFRVNFPAIPDGVRTLDIALMTPSLMNGTVSTLITALDSEGKSLATYSVPAMMSTAATVSGNDPEQYCVMGMGALAGFCGTYSGSISKISDSSIRCNEFIPSGNTTLEVRPEGQFVLHYNVPTIINSETPFLPNHVDFLIGGLENPPTSTSFSVTRRNCSTPFGTTFVSGNCQNITLSGSFSQLVGTKRFTGTYTIIDTVNRDSCSFAMDLNKTQ